jgi:glycosyltransferase involved in cell wall biosynthesis
VRILFVSQLFDPENAIKGAAFVRQLQQFGHEVEVITAFPSYPGGQIFKGYKQSWRSIDDMAGVRVVRVPSFISHGQSAIKRLLSYGSFAFSAAWYAMFSAKRPDVIYAYYPPVMVGLMALVVGWVRRVPYVYDVQDLWPEALVATGHVQADGQLVKWIERLCGLVYSRAARVVVLSQGYRDSLIRKGVHADKVVCVYNWCDESRMSAAAEVPAVWCKVPGTFRVLYAGNLGAAQALSHVVDAAALLHASGDIHIQLVFLGAGVEQDALRLRAKHLPNVTFLSQVKVDDVGGYLKAADVLLVHLADDPVFDITIPQKTQAYLLAGKPILMGVRGESGALVSAAKAGLVVPSENALAMADAMRALASKNAEELLSMGQGGFDFYNENMSMSKGVRQIEKLLSEVVAK